MLDPFGPEKDPWIYRGYGIRLREDQIGDMSVYQRWLAPLFWPSIHGLAQTYVAEGSEWISERFEPQKPSTLHE